MLWILITQILLGGLDATSHAIIIDTSRLWSNYRHTTNALSFYSVVRKMGIPSHRISLLIPGDIECNPRNTFPGEVFHTPSSNLYARVRADYKGDEISRESISRLLAGRHAPHTPRSYRLRSRSDSKLFVFLTGHSGIGFAKLQDTEEFYAVEIAELFDEMDIKERYRKMLWIGDTCRAASLHDEFYSKNIVSVGSSGDRESSYSRHRIEDLGISVVDRFSYSAEIFLNKHIVSRSKLGMSVRSFAHSDNFPRRELLSDVSTRTDLYEADDGGRLLDFISDTDEIVKASIAVGDWSAGTVGFAQNNQRSVEKPLLSRNNGIRSQFVDKADNNRVIFGRYTLGITVLPILVVLAKHLG